ncbi:MAG: hypothetical protein P1U32_05695 [Legionellaceae bacterium]|nr:hypothetical protein [Legionellaceae bacterium]
MKQFLMIVCLLGASALVGCATTQSNHTTNTQADKTVHAKQTQKSGTYFGTGVGIGVMSF